MSTDLEQVVVSEEQVLVIQSDSPQVVLTGLMGPPGFTSITNANDVDKLQLTDGAVLVYKSQTATWKATNILDNQIIEAGQF